MLPLRFGILAEAISKTHYSHRCQHHHSHRNHSHLTKQNTCPHEYQHQLLTQILHGILTYIFNNGIAITLHQPLNPSFPDVAGTPRIRTLRGTSTIPTTAQRSQNHLAILKHHHNNNEYNNNNTVSATNTQEKYQGYQYLLGVLSKQGGYQCNSH